MAKLDDEIKELEDELQVLRSSLAAARSERAIANCPRAVGQVLVQRGGRLHGRKARVRAIIPGYGESYRLRGALIRKNGLDGKRTIELYGFEDWRPEEDGQG